MTARHFLVVAPFDPGDETGRFDVEHPPGCPVINQGDDKHPVLVENCGVGFHVDYYGITEYFVHADDDDSPDTGRERVLTGRHEIEAWHEVHRGPDYVEHSAGLRIRSAREAS